MSKLAKTIVTPKERIVDLITAAEPNCWAVSRFGLVCGYVTGIGNGDGVRANKWAITGTDTTYRTRGSAIDALLDAAR